MCSVTLKNSSPANPIFIRGSCHGHKAIKIRKIDREINFLFNDRKTKTIYISINRLESTEKEDKNEEF
jgi:hypothetical protein